MKKGTLKNLMVLTLLVAVVLVTAGCSSAKKSLKNNDSTATYDAKTNINLPKDNTKSDGTKGDLPKAETVPNYHEAYIDQSFSTIESQLGTLEHQYYWEGGDHYSVEDSDLVFAFSAYDVNSESPCTSISASLKTLFPKLAQIADSNGILTYDQISEYFDFTYNYHYDDHLNMCYVGTAYVKGASTNKTYMILIYPESDGSCSIDDTLMIKEDNR